MSNGNLEPIASVILIDKPCGVTSFKVTSSIRHKLHIKKAGHAGTLDPLATGVLPIMTGKATRLIDLIPDDKKTYSAEFMLGLTTDTLDNEGEILSEQPVKCTNAEIVKAIMSFTGEIEQIPPMYSALKKDGMKLYDLARQGIEVERKSRKITIYDINIESITPFDDTFLCKMSVTCSKGTYIRTLIDDIGTKLHCGAIMTSLRRSHSNGFDISQCMPLEQFMRLDEKELEKYILPPDKAVNQYISITVSAAQSKRFSNGGELDIIRIKGKKDFSDGEIFRVYSDTEIFLGLGEIKGDSLCPKCVF